MIGLALSGGGSRAIAFHLGCLRALHDRGVLSRVNVISAVSGGSIIAAMYGYSSDPFEDFDQKVRGLLKRGLQRPMALRLMSPRLLPRVLATNLVSQPVAGISQLLRVQPPLRRWASRTDSLEAVVAGIVGAQELNQVQRPNFDIVFNACELRTGTAFRFSNKCSGSWRTGEIRGNKITVAHAVACSAAYPVVLPAFDRRYVFTKNGTETKRRVIIADGGVYDNLGITCLEPGRDKRFSLHNYPADYLICCSAGQGQLSGESIPYGFYTRVSSAYRSTFRKVQDAAFDRLHTYQRDGRIKGFILPYLGQQDPALPIRPPDLVPRNDVMDYPTNFAAMSEDSVNKLTKRGEQLTRLLLEYYCPEL